MNSVDPVDGGEGIAAGSPWAGVPMLVVVLSHLASYQDKANWTGGRRCGGYGPLHTGYRRSGQRPFASDWWPAKSDGVPVVQAYYNGRALGKISLVYSRREQKILVSSVQSMETPVKDAKADPEIAAIVARSQSEILPVKNIPLGRTLSDLSHERL